jgi:hypothetical protein
MPAERTAMRHVREVLRLRTAGISGNEIARRLNLAPSTVRLTLQRLATAGFGWPLPAELTDAAVEARLFSAVGTKQGHRRHAEPDWAEVYRELKRKHVTLQILRDEYIERCPHGYRYSRFCELYRLWASRLSVTMQQTHANGDKLFIITPAIRCRWSSIGSMARPGRRRFLSPCSAPPTSPTPRWRRITTPRSCRHGRAGRATRRAPEPGCAAFSSTHGAIRL